MYAIGYMCGVDTSKLLINIILLFMFHNITTLTFIGATTRKAPMDLFLGSYNNFQSNN